MCPGFFFRRRCLVTLIFLFVFLFMSQADDESAMADYERSFSSLQAQWPESAPFLERLSDKDKAWLVEGFRTEDGRQDFLGFINSFPPFTPVWKTLRSYTSPNRNKVSHHANMANAASALTTEALSRQAVWLNTHRQDLLGIFEKTHVNPEILAAIYYAETKLSTYRLPHLLYEVLFTQIALLENGVLSNESDQRKRLQRLKGLARASLVSLYTYARRTEDEVLQMRSSWAGAVGPMQLMPFNFQFLEDGNADGRVRADQEKDSLMGAAAFLHSKGYGPQTAQQFVLGKGDEEILNILLRYNASRPYAQGVLDSARGLQAEKIPVPLMGR